MVAPNEANLEKLVGLLTELGARKRVGSKDFETRSDPSTSDFKADLPVGFFTEHGALNVITELPGVGNYDRVRRSARRYSVDDTVLVVADIDDVITSKETIDRSKDWRAISRAPEDARAEV